MSPNLDRLRKMMAQHDLAGLALCASENVTAFAGTHLITQTIVPDRLAFLVLAGNGSDAVVVSDIEESLARSQTSIEDVRVYVEFIERPATVVAELLDEFGVRSGRIGIDARRMSKATADEIGAGLPGVTLVPVDDELEAIQMVKEAGVVEQLTRAARNTQSAIEAAISASSIGETELDLTSRITGDVARRGGILSFLVFGSGKGGLVSHLEAGARVMEEGEIFRLDVGARFPVGVLSDLGRAGVVGEPTDEQQNALRALRNCQQEGFNAIEPGRPAKDIFQACKRAFAGNQLPFTMPHVGHGLGIALHEKPRLHPSNETRLAAGMVLNVEVLAVLAERSEGYFTEDLVLVTDEGHEILTTPQEELLVMGTASS